jgi:hypothetical protein
LGSGGSPTAPYELFYEQDSVGDIQMGELLSLLTAFIGLCAWLISIFIAYFLSNNRVRIAVAFGILGGICAGVYMRGIPFGLLLGLIIGFLFDLLIIPGGLLIKYYQRKGRKILQKRKYF